MVGLVALIGLALVGVAWRATTDGGVHGAAVALVAIGPVAVGIGIASGNVLAGIAPFGAFAAGYMIGVALRFRTPVPLSGTRVRNRIPAR